MNQDICGCGCCRIELCNAIAQQRSGNANCEKEEKLDAEIGRKTASALNADLNNNNRHRGEWNCKKQLFRIALRPPLSNGAHLAVETNAHLRQMFAAGRVGY